MLAAPCSLPALCCASPACSSTCDNAGPGACDEGSCYAGFGWVEGACAACTANCTSCDGDAGQCTACVTGFALEDGAW